MKALQQILNRMDNIEKQKMMLISARHFADLCNCSASSVKKFDGFTGIGVTFGDMEYDDFTVSITMYDIDNTVNRMIVSLGKNHKGKSIYTESCLEDVFESFMWGAADGVKFDEWLHNTLDKLEDRF